MRSIFACVVVAGLLFVGSVFADEADESPSVPLGTPPLGDQLKQEPSAKPARARSFNPAPNGNPFASVAKIGQPENRWRYRYSNGRWWYWTAGNQWSYFDGNRWTAYRPTGGFMSQKVDPALLRLEGKEGTLGYKRWQHAGGGGAGMSGTSGSVGGGGGQGGRSMGGTAGTARSGGAGAGAGFGISGTRGSMGGGASGSWTVSPSTPNTLNTTVPRSGATGKGMGGAGTGR